MGNQPSQGIEGIGTTEFLLQGRDDSDDPEQHRGGSGASGPEFSTRVGARSTGRRGSAPFPTSSSQDLITNNARSRNGHNQCTSSSPLSALKLDGETWQEASVRPDFLTTLQGRFFDSALLAALDLRKGHAYTHAEYRSAKMRSADFERALAAGVLVFTPLPHYSSPSSSSFS